MSTQSLVAARKLLPLTLQWRDSTESQRRIADPSQAASDRVRGRIETYVALLRKAMDFEREFVRAGRER